MRILASILPLFLVIASPVLVAGQTFDVEPGPVASFEITAPRISEAGVELPIRIVARDGAGNIATNFDRIRSTVLLRLVPGEIQGGIEPARFAASDFRQGVLEARVVLKTAATISIGAEDASSGASGRSDPIEVSSGPVAEIRVAAPRDVRVGVPFEASIELFDRFGNRVSDHDRRGGELSVVAGVSGARGAFEPARLSPSHFSMGRAVVKFRYSRAEQTVLEVRLGEVAGQSAPLVARAGNLSEIRVTLPETEGVAGVPFPVILEVKDENGSVIANFDRVGEALTLVASGVGELSPSVVSPSLFRDGIATIDVTYKVAESLKVSVFDKAGVKRGESDGAVRIVGGRLGRMEVVAAERARAGEPLAVQVMAFDNFGNVIRDFTRVAAKLRLGAADGSPLEAPLLTDREFVGGTAFLMVKPYKSGALSIVAMDEITGTTGRSQTIQVAAGDVASFTIRARSQVIAREPFDVEITALDRFGNVVREYARTGSGVVVEAPLEGGLTPVTVPASAFMDGSARVSFTYNAADRISLTIVEQGGTARGVSDFIFVTHADARKFRIDGGGEATAGTPFKLRITAVDDYGNPAISYGRRDGQVALYAENGSPMAPPYFSRSAFVNGVAEVDVVFLSSGDVRVHADAMSASGEVAGVSAEIRVEPGSPSRLVLSAPAEIIAGEPFRLRVEMSDRLGNRNYAYSPKSTSLLMRVVRDGQAAPTAAGVELEDISRMVFRDGVAELTVRATKASEIALELRDELLGVSGRSQAIRVMPAPVSAFRIESLSPTSLRAGELMKLRATALDEFGNVDLGYGLDGAGVRLTARVKPAIGVSGAEVVASAGDVLLPATLSGKLFVGGAANFYSLYGRAERIEIVADRLPAGAVTRAEVVAIAAEERSGGTRVSLLCNAPVDVDAIRTLTESLIELRIPGAILSSMAPSVTKRGGLVSMVSLAQTDQGVRVLLHTGSPAAVRSASEGNRVIIDVDPVVGRPAPLPMIETIRPPEPVPAQIPALSPETRGGAGASGVSSPTMADVNRMVREAKYAEALSLVNIMLGATPGDVALQGVKRRLETLVGLGPSQSPAPAPQPAAALPPIVPAALPIPALQNNAKPVEMETNMASIEAAIRAGSYSEAKSMLDRFIDSHPNDEKAKKMRSRVEQLMNLLKTNTPK